MLEQGQACGLRRIERLMREKALQAKPQRRGPSKDRGVRNAVTNNVLDRRFQADYPNQRWVADFAYIWTAEGWLYVAAVLDLYSRRIVGSSMQESMCGVGQVGGLAASLGSGQPAHQRAEAAG